MTKTLIAALCAAAAVSLAAPAFADHHGGPLEAKFKEADKDADGTLDKTEAAAMPMVLKHFEAIDADKDGTVSLDEVKAGMGKRMKGMKGMKDMHAKGKAMFDAADKDKDGTLDKEEAKGMKHVAEHFDEIDGDKDGTVSMDEIHAFMKSHRHGKAK